MNQETKVGLLVLSGLLALATVIVLLGDIHIRKGYNVNVLFDDIAGLQEKAPVKIAGVEIGKVSNISLVKNKACVVVWINSKVKVYNNAQANIFSTGVIGTKYLEMMMGSEDKPLLKDGDTITGINPISFDKLVDRVIGGLDELMSVLRNVTGNDGAGNSLKEIFNNINEISKKINLSLGPTEDDLRGVVVSFRDFSKNMEEFSAELKKIMDENGEQIGEGLGRFAAISQKLEEVLDSFSKISKKIEQGEGVVGKLIMDEKAAKDVAETLNSINNASKETEKVLKRISGFRTIWDYQLHYNVDEKMVRNDFGIRIEPTPEKFYYFGVNNITESDNNLKYDKGEQKINSFSANIGKTVGDFTFYGGLIRSTGGIGITYHPFDKKTFGVNVEAFNFSRQVDQKTKAWINAGGKIGITEWWYLGINGEDLLEQKTFNTTLNLAFNDDDLAYLFGLAGFSSAAKR